MSLPDKDCFALDATQGSNLVFRAMGVSGPWRLPTGRGLSAGNRIPAPVPGVRNEPARTAWGFQTGHTG